MRDDVSPVEKDTDPEAPGSSANSELLVVGSVNWDHVAYVRDLPMAGETLSADRFTTGLGGKGANQAIAAANLGARVALVGRVGNDQIGTTALEILNRYVDVSMLGRDAEAATGAAYITVASSGENTIIVEGGANTNFGSDYVDERISAYLRQAPTKPSIILAQGEVSPDALASAAAIATEYNLRLVVNLAPVIHIDRDVLKHARPLIVNQREAAVLLREQQARSQNVTLDAHAPGTHVARALAESLSTSARIHRVNWCDRFRCGRRGCFRFGHA